MQYIEQKTTGKHLASRKTQSDRLVSIVLALQRKRKGKLGIGDSFQWINSGQWSHGPKVHFQAPPREKDPSQSSSKSKSVFIPRSKNSVRKERITRCSEAWKSKLTLMLQLPQKHAAFWKTCCFFWHPPEYMHVIREAVVRMTINVRLCV